jgi:hypothetical protein
MARMRILWNYVTANRDTNINALSRSVAPGIVKTTVVGTGCVGVFFRSVISDDPDFSQFLSGITLEEYRRARNEPDNTLLFKPKPQEQKSIATLRIVRPSRFTRLSGTTAGGTGHMDFPREYDVTHSQFDILLESTEFILEDVQEQMAERFQLQETFGNFNVFFFGKRAEIFTYSGTLFNACNNLQWRNQFLDDYENFLRGTKCAQRRARAYLLYDDVVREGFILSAGISQNSAVEAAVKFNFTLLVTGKRILTAIPDIRVAKVVNAGLPKDPRSITDFLFFRSVDPDLPMVGASSGVVSPAFEDEISLLEASPDFAFTVNDALPGDEPTSDLKQAMINRSLDALDKTRQSGQATEAGTLDHDILIDFIDRGKLPTNASLLAAGVKTVDINNLKGREAVLLLTASPPSITVADLSLKDALTAAESFSTEFASAIGGSGGIAGDLGLLANHLKIDSKCRISKSVPESGAASMTVDWAKVKDLKKGCEGKGFVLHDSENDKPLVQVIKETEPIRSFNPDAANGKVVDELTVSALNVFLSDKDALNLAKLIQLYAASFCLIKNPSGDLLFPEISTNFPNANLLGGKPDAIQFIESQKLKSLTEALATLPDTVASALTAAIDNVKASGLLSTIASRAATNVMLLPIHEIVLTAAALDPQFSPQASFSFSKFLHNIGVYITAIVSDAVPGATIQSLSTDNVGGSVLPPSGNRPELVYFTPETFTRLSLTDGDPAPDIQTGRTVRIATSAGTYISRFLKAAPAGGAYLITPIGTRLPTESVLVSTANPSTGFSDVRFSVSGTGMDETDKALHSYGYSRLTPAQASSILTRAPGQGNMFVVAFGTTLRNVRVLPPEANDAFALGLTSMPVDRSYFGGQPKQYAVTNLDGIRSVAVSGVGSAVRSAAPKVVKSAKDKVAKLVTGEDKLPEDRASRNLIVGELALEKFSGVAPIKALDVALRTVGVTVGDYLNLLVMRDTEKDMANKLVSLKSLLEQAVATMSANKAGAEAAKSDSAGRANLCK